MPVLPSGYQTVLISCGTYGFVRLCTLNGCLIDSHSFLLLYKIAQTRRSAPEEGDNSTVWLHVTAQGPGNTYFI